MLSKLASKSWPKAKPKTQQEKEQEIQSQAMSKGAKKGAVNHAHQSEGQSAIKVVHRLEATVNRIPSSVPYAAPDHRLNAFAIDPHACVANLEPNEDDWAILNPMFKASFG
jgi:hypothetical protein